METIENLKEQLTQIQGRLSKAKEVFREMDAKMKEKDSELEILKNQVVEQNEKYKELEGLYKDANSTINDQDEEISNLNSTIEYIKKSITEHVKFVQKSLDDISEL
jgi:chromosome segregation ATPase